MQGVVEIDDAEVQVVDGGIQGEAEEQQLQRGRDDEGDGQAPVAADLVELLAHERAQADAEEFTEDTHALNCILRILFQAMK